MIEYIGDNIIVVLNRYILPEVLFNILHLFYVFSFKRELFLYKNLLILFIL